MSRNFNPDIPNASLGTDTVLQHRYRIARKLDKFTLIAAVTIAVLAGVYILRALFWPVKLMPTKVDNVAAPVPTEPASVSANDNLGPLPQWAKTTEDNRASEHSEELAITWKKPATEKLHNRSGGGKQVPSGASRKPLERVTTRRTGHPKPQSCNNSPTPRVYGSSSVAAARAEPEFLAAPDGTGIVRYVRFSNKTNVYLDPRRRDASAVSPSR